MPPAVHVRGLRELGVAFSIAERDARLFVRAELRNVAVPIAREAESLSVARISRIHRSPKWTRMRIGVTRSLIYVAPRQKGTRGRDWKRSRGSARGIKADFGAKLMGLAMEPALQHHEPDVMRRMEAALDRMADHFNRGGIVT